ncbi:hypothetical protein [Plebeiibacterium sediminum]|uniref:Uncharacterized protein n=1 Tax=Plebeiibacterium sediminum TaxID=2992112 RepID=A0AAE3M7M8_9BACT|nr:hypothetical protein [Plebeiobacterium sediminum]MCW3788603.1 hypothetical protein [Plebeiobacterium sediminum]
MKSKHDQHKKNKRSAYDEVSDRNGLKPVKPKSGKSKRLSIYDEIDEDMDFELDDDSFRDTDFDDNYFDDEDDY